MKHSKKWRENYVKYARTHRSYAHRLMFMPCIRKCDVCGKKFVHYERPPKNDDDLTVYTSKHNVCYECAFWLTFIDNKPKELQVANGIAYKIFPFIEEPTLSMLLGGNGKKRFFVTKDRQVIKSNDVWVVGTIPQHFRDKLPDTGWFCNKSVYGRILRFNKMCKEVGCLDRYKCFRFRTDLELENGPYNTLPKGWETGDEHCGFFVNTEGIENYVSPISTNEI